MPIPLDLNATLGLIGSGESPSLMVLGNTAIGLYLGAKVLLGGWVAARAGRSPLWALALVVPFLEVIIIWLFAVTRWPAAGRRPEPRAPEISAGR